MAQKLFLKFHVTIQAADICHLQEIGAKICGKCGKTKNKRSKSKKEKNKRE